jgi:hypothetical protein
MTGTSFAQTDRLWSKNSQKSATNVFEDKTNINDPKIYSLDFNGLKNLLSRAPKRLVAGEKSEVIISFPNSEGKMEISK